MGFQQSKHVEDICSFWWGGDAVTTLKRLHGEEAKEVICFKKSQNQMDFYEFTSVEQLNIPCASSSLFIRFLFFVNQANLYK